MKRFVCMLLSCTVLFLVSCDKYNDPAFISQYTASSFSYDFTGACAFTANNGKLYVAFADQPDIGVYNENGSKVDSLVLGEGIHTNLSLYQNQLFAFTYGTEALSIAKYDLLTRKLTVHKMDLDITSVIAMTVVNNKIYLIYWSEGSDDYQESVKYETNDNYIYMGEKAIALDIDTFEEINIDIKNVINLSQYSTDEIAYYAYDDIGGYYFTIYNTETNQFSKKYYNNAPLYTFSFACYHDNIVFADFSNRKITSVSMQSSDIQIDFIPNVLVASGNDLQMDGDNCYVLDNATGNIFRTSYIDTVKDNKEIKLYTSEVFSEVPYGCGYRISTSRLNDDDFALNILAENQNYDICMMTSKQLFSQSIRDKGAFYPLNEIPMVSEYLDACHPYLKNAATKDSGEIWMIPIAINIPAILYQPENCEREGIQLNKNTSWEYLFDAARRLYEKEELRDQYALNGYQVENDILSHYNSYYAVENGHANYNTSLFRDVCNMLKKYDVTSDFLHTWIHPLDHYYDLTDYYKDYTFEYTAYLFYSTASEAFSALRAIPTPSLNNEEPSCADCIYFCVNARSDNLNATLDFINSYCSYMLGRNDTYMLKDQSIYPYSETALANDLYQIYSNAEIYFAPSEEMFWNDYHKFRNDELSLDDFITEIERKSNMYLNE